MRIRFDENTSVEVIRSARRKSAQIRVENGQVSLLAPSALSPDRLESLILKKSAWIRHKLQLQAQMKPTKTKEFIAGETFSYLGRHYRLKVLDGELSVRLRHGYLEVACPLTCNEEARLLAIRRSIIRWYKDHAHQKIHSRFSYFQNQLGLAPSRITIRDFSSRWGSCSVRGHISYNWRIIMASSRVIDYVIVHELCHLNHHDHSEAFWDNVRKIIPDWEKDRQWLKDHAQLLFSV
jgi:predicted metal-dependent hydrolase